MQTLHHRTEVIGLATATLATIDTYIKDHQTFESERADPGAGLGRRLLVLDVLDRLKKEGLQVPVIVGGIIPEEDARTLEDAGVSRVYTPKDFDLTRIMGELVELVAEKHAA